MKCILFSITAVIFFAAVIFSCSNNNNGNFIVSENGTKYKIHHLGDDTANATESEIVTVKLLYRLGDSVIFNSDDTEEGNMRFPITAPLFKGDLYAALALMGTGDSITVVIVADSFYLKTAALKELPEGVQPGSNMYYDIKMLKHISSLEWQAEMNAKSKENQQLEKIELQNYIINNNIDVAPTPSGLFFIPLKKGSGAKPDTGDMCRLYISVKEMLNNKLLYNNFNGTPLDVEYGKFFDTEGFTEGLSMLKPGGKARLIVPSWIGVSSAVREVVDPFTTLIYEVELLTIRSPEKAEKDK